MGNQVTEDAVYACTQDGFFYRSNGRGQWSQGQDIDPDSRSSCYAIWGTGPDNIYVAASRIFRGRRAP